MQALELHRRRWTAMFSIPIAFVMVSSGVYGVTFVDNWFSGRNAWLAMGVIAFVTLCVAGPLLLSAWVAFTHRKPAVVVDARGVTDVARGAETVPWSQIERIKVDGHEHCILIHLKRDSGVHTVRNRILRTARRWLDGGDVVITLSGIQYDEEQLQATLKAFHSQSRRGGLPDG